VTPATSGPARASSVPGAEICNELDDDCDGTVDDAAHVGEACTLGVGACASPGVLRCVADEAEPECDAAPGDPKNELCNGQDDDCDGVVDDGFRLGEACVQGVGQCARNGVRVCDADLGAACNAAAGMGGPEVCNGLDDDCDGMVDDGAAATLCPAVARTTVACRQGACVYTCHDRYFDADGNPGNGCERGCSAAPAGWR
jgi:hypothetical protein